MFDSKEDWVIDFWFPMGLLAIFMTWAIYQVNYDVVDLQETKIQAEEHQPQNFSRVEGK